MPEATPAPVKVEIAKKLSMKGIIGAAIPKPADEDGKREILLCVVGGMAAGLKHGESNFGPWTALLGNFKAVPAWGEKTGKELRTGQLFLPDAALNTITPYVENLAKGDTVSFAFEIGVRYDKDAATGYVYFCNMAVQPTETDPFEALFAGIDIPQAPPALPAPAGDQPNTDAENDDQEKVDPDTGEVSSDQPNTDAGNKKKR